MTELDRKPFADLLTATLQVYSTPIGPQVIGIWWAALARYPLEAVRAGLSAHVTDPHAGRFTPKPADVISHLTQNDGRPGADEAWALCPLAESQTTVWTEEARMAFFEAAYGLLETDRIAARMAFKDAYNRHVATARRALEPVVWTASLGTDAGGRESVLRAAVEQGRLEQTYVAGLLPYSGTGTELAKRAHDAMRTT